MNNQISDERLRAEVEGLRAELRRMSEWYRMVVAEVERLRAQLQADDERAWETLGRPEGTYDSTNVQRLCAEVERLKDDAARWHNLLPVYEDAEQEVKQLRADLREAMELLAQVDDGQVPHDTWLDARNALLAKHKETQK